MILGEPFTRYSLAGTVLVCIGALLIATFGAIGEPAHSLDQLLSLLQRRPFLLWMGGTTLLVVIILMGINLLNHFTCFLRAKPPTTGHFTPYLLRRQSQMRLIRGMSYGFVSGILSAHSLLLAKSAVELLVRTIVDGVNQFNRWQSWVILLGMIFLALTQLFYLHRGLKLCSTSVLYPFVFCIYNIIAIMDGLIYFRQVSQLAGFHAGLIALGTIVLLAGVLCLSWRLEDIDNNAAVTTVGPTQTGLGPGMAVMEEHPPSSPGWSDGSDGEFHAGERESLLSPKTTRHFSYRRGRLPSLSPSLHFRHRDSADLNPASIWAELDDSDYDSDSGQRRSSADQLRNGSPTLGSPSQGLARHSAISAGTHHRRGSRHHQRPHISIPQGRTSTVHRRQRSTGNPVVSSHHQFGGYGTILGNADDVHEREYSLHQPDTTDSGLLAGSRRALAGAWTFGRRLLPRWSSPRAGNETEADIGDGSASSLLPRSEANPP